MNDCYKCKQIKDEILVFQCGHDLCLECATQNYQIQLKKLSTNIDYIFCEFCFKTTQLDIETINELNGSHNANQNIFKTLPKSSFENSYTTQQQQMFCKIHIEHEVCYFCFDCFCECICPECIIHGDHKNHNVLSLKKAIPQVFKQMQNFTQEQIQKIQKNQQYQIKLKNNFEQVQQQYQQQKTELKQIFQDFRDQINENENVINQMMDNAFLKQRSNFDNTFQKIIKNIENLENKLQNFQQPKIDHKYQQIQFLNSYVNKKFNIEDIHSQKNLVFPNFKDIFQKIKQLEIEYQVTMEHEIINKQKY